MGRTSARSYYEAPAVPWCLLGKVSWGVVTAVRVPEAQAAEYVTKHGFIVLIRDSEFPVPIDGAGTMPDIIIPAQSNPRRHPYRQDAEWTQSEDGA